MQLRILHPVKAIGWHSRRHLCRPLRTVRVRCEGDDKDKKSSLSAEEKFAEQLKKQGFQKENAQSILQLWKESGAESPEQLRKLFIRGSLRPLSVVLLQLLLDAGATFGSFTFASSIGFAPGLPFPVIFSLLGTLAGFYFLTSTAFDIVTLGSILFSIYRFGTNTEAFLAALESIAGGSDLSVIDKAKKIVDIFKVIQALNEIADILKVRKTDRSIDMHIDAGKRSRRNIHFRESLCLLDALSCRDQLRIPASEVWIDRRRSDEHCCRLLEIRSERRRCAANIGAGESSVDHPSLPESATVSCSAELGTPLEEDELNTAMTLLDTDGSGVIEFEEFVNWWVNKVKPERADIIKN